MYNPLKQDGWVVTQQLYEQVYFIFCVMCYVFVLSAFYLCYTLCGKL